MTAIALTIAGSDSGGGAGIQADLKTFSALGVYGCSVLTALTAQNTLGVQAIQDLPIAFIEEQMRSVFNDLAIGAVKIGMLSQGDVMRAIADQLDALCAVPVVFDPVMVAASGDPLVADDAVAVLKTTLLSRAHLITPNLHEAARLLNGTVAANEHEMEVQGQALLDLGARAVLMKGGHSEGEESVDLLVTPDGVMRVTSPRHETTNTHGTGCTLSSAIAAGLAKGLSLQMAVEEAKAYISAAIAASDQLNIGHGHGPVHHFHAIW